MSYIERIRDEANQFWDSIMEHPMVKGIGTGNLDEDKFRYWVKQDYVYLIEYSNMFAYITARIDDFDRKSTFADLLQETLNTEMDLHRSYAEEFGISEEALEDTVPSPTTQAYTDFLVRVASTGPIPKAIAALLPCMWGFNETGKRLEEEGPPDHELYARWIEMYSSDEFTELNKWCQGVLNDLASGATESMKKSYDEAFRISARYEYMFWDAAWTGEEWPL